LLVRSDHSPIFLSEQKEHGMRISKEVVRKFMVPKDKDKAWVKIKHLTEKELERLSLSVTNQEIVYGEDKKQKSVQSMNLGDISNAFYHATIIDWGGFFDDDGKEIKCIPKNIDTFLDRAEGFKDFIVGCKQKLEDDIEKEKRGQEKNL